MTIAVPGAGRLSVIKTLGAAIGAAIVILLLATVASRITSHSDPDTQELALHR
jgi:Na+-translocating ferredoxin:NAD+ oxidoreductase RnfA subunit